MKVKIDSGEVEVNKLAIGKYAELLAVLRAMPGKVTGMFVGTNTEMFARLPEFLEMNLPEAIKLISIGTGISEEKVSSLGLSECIDLLVAVIEVNQYKDIYEKLKKATAQFQVKKVIPTTAIGSPTQ